MSARYSRCALALAMASQQAWGGVVEVRTQSPGVVGPLVLPEVSKTQGLILQEFLGSEPEIEGVPSEVLLKLWEFGKRDLDEGQLQALAPAVAAFSDEAAAPDGRLVSDAASLALAVKEGASRLRAQRAALMAVADDPGSTPEQVRAAYAGVHQIQRHELWFTQDEVKQFKRPFLTIWRKFRAVTWDRLEDDIARATAVLRDRPADAEPRTQTSSPKVSEGSLLGHATAMRALLDRRRVQAGGGHGSALIDAAVRRRADFIHEAAVAGAPRERVQTVAVRELSGLLHYEPGYSVHYAIAGIAERSPFPRVRQAAFDVLLEWARYVDVISSNLPEDWTAESGARPTIHLLERAVSFVIQSGDGTLQRHAHVRLEDSAQRTPYPGFRDLLAAAARRVRDVLDGPRRPEAPSP